MTSPGVEAYTQTLSRDGKKLAFCGVRVRQNDSLGKIAGGRPRGSGYS